MARQTIGGWIREILSSEEEQEKGAKCTALVLVHMVGMQQQEITQVKFGLSTTLTPENIGAKLKKKAEDYCQDMPGVQMFQVLAFFGNRQEPEARYPFGVNVNNHGENGLSTENPTSQGTLQQNMRHAEMLVQQVYRRQQAHDDFTVRFSEAMIGVVDRLTAQLDRSMERQIEASNIAIDLMQRFQDRDHERKMEQARYARETAERKRWLQYAPALINSILGREVFPVATEDTALVETICDALGESEIAKLGGVLPPELYGPLANRMAKHQAKKAKEEEEVRALMPPVVDPESEAAGDVQPPSTSMQKRKAS